MGAIMVVGIVHKNGILMLDAEKHFTDQGCRCARRSYQAGRRLRPILMTALATIFGMLPLALGVGPGAQMLQPARHRGDRRRGGLDGSVSARSRRCCSTSCANEAGEDSRQLEKRGRMSRIIVDNCQEVCMVRNSSLFTKGIALLLFSELRRSGAAQPSTRSE